MAALPQLNSEPPRPAADDAETRVCALLVDRGRLKQDDLARAERLLAEAPETRLTALLARLGLVSERDLAEAWSATLQLPLWPAKDAPDTPPETALSVRFMKQYHAVPVAESGSALQVATADPGDPYIAHAVQLACGRQVSLVVAARSEIDDLIERWHGAGRSALGTIVEGLEGEGREASGDDDIEHLRDLASEAPVIRLVNLLIQRAVEARASDIHIEPFESRLKVRYRIDGVLHEVEAPPASSTAAVISRIKIMARMNIAERRLPQDGRIMLRVQGKELDLRVSCIPTSFGESVVMRILDRGSVVLDFDSLGFDEHTLPAFLRVLGQPHGILLVTGPTGSGKTTTLYTALAKINTPDRKIITVEDPVEYQLEGINQMQVKPQIGLDFAGALRSIVRQDPDVIMIGEMRDLETCKIAIQSALTGHLVLSTLHTNSAAGGLTRLLDMGVEDYLLASTVNAILAQRLVRRLDPASAEAYEPLPELVAELGLDKLATQRPIRLYRPRPSPDNPSGYRGRLAIIEQLTMDDALRRLLMQHADASDIERAARDSGMRTMYEDGLRKALAGLTTIEEVLRVTQEA
ncbi:MAG: type II secretion system ATPase GspE [Xanthomonadales bacterium]|nr:type II secretion system ATPase GspE [Xanthomonadales bacterium]ODU91712.1 MAG: type II secretion system protein GspE [Rhodanobacter sp. SCN 66-43]OJY85015.1 MAG: type II secretion system protein GspE [Xanthomonadales bacterium 66-474]